MRTLPIHLAILGALVGLTGCPSDDGPRAPDDSANPGPADDGTSGAPKPGPAAEPGDGDGDQVESCEEARKRLEDELAECKAGAK